MRNLDKKYVRGSEEIHVLQGLNLAVDRGDFIGLLFAFVMGLVGGRAAGRPRRPPARGRRAPGPVAGETSIRRSGPGFG